MKFNIHDFQWTREPASFTLSEDRIEIVTKPHTDLWQRTYYHFRNDNAPVLQMETEEKFFSFVVKTSFDESHHRFDQCGIVMYLDSDNWLKGSIEYENDRFQHLGSVVTNNGYSDWATTEIPADVKTMWYRLSRREDDYCIECSYDGEHFAQMRVCHMWQGGGKIRFGIYACSPEDSSFKAVFTDMALTECKWLAHDGQQPGAESPPMKLYDISQEVFSCAVYPGDPVPEKRMLSATASGDLYNLTAFSMCAHNGTHVDAPFHFLQEGRTVDQMPLDTFVGDCWVARHNGDVTAADAARILENACGAERILIAGSCTVTLEAAEAFAASGIRLLGNESQSVGPEDAPMEVHLAFLRRGVALLEGLVLTQVPEGRYFLSAAPLNLSGADGAPCRACLIGT